MIRKTAIARSVALAFGVAAAGMWVAPAAYAQSNTVGAIYGAVESAAGAEVLVESKETGFKRTIKPDPSGRFNMTSVPTGTYTVSLVRNGQVVNKQEGVDVLLGQGVEVNLAATQTVQVRGSRVAKIDTSSATSAAVFTAKDLERLPVAGNVGAIIQLSPNTTKGDSRYGGAGAPSIGGASASENAYYINGFPVTTLLTQVGFSQLPFNSIGQAQVLSGGYGAEFGRSTGGVVNIITKRGSNEWEVGGQASFEPNSLRAREKDIYYEVTGATSGGLVLDNKLRLYNGLNKQDRTTYSIYAGGPIIKDKLFIFGAFEAIKTKREDVRTFNTSAVYNISAPTQATSFEKRDLKDPRYLLKLDWAITDNHTLEYTRIGEKVTDTRTYYGFNYATLQKTDVVGGGVEFENWGPTPVASQQGATVDILKYTGYLTDDLTFTALVGKTRTPHKQVPTGYNPALPQVVLTATAPGLNYTAPQGNTGSLVADGAFDENKGTRFDVEYKLNSQHKLRGGIDYNTIDSKAGNVTAGGVIYTYLKATNPADPVQPNSTGPGAVAGNALAQQGYYVLSSTGLVTKAEPRVKQQAQYLEDQWQYSKDLLLILGLRNEGFDNQNSDKQTYIKLSRQIAPRLAAVWDTKGDATSVIKATAGRYHVPLPTNVAVRGAGSALNTSTPYAYTGVDPVTGAPTGLTALGPVYSANNEYGKAKDPREVSAQGIKGNFQDELTLGIEQALTKEWKGSAKVTYRALKTVLDDHCDDRPFLAWAKRNGVDASNWGYNCALFNPGLDNTFTIDLNGDGKLENIALSAADLGFPKPKRTYLAFDFGLEHAFDGKYWAKLNYTFSRNKGNAEGQLLSDIGQADVATTQAWDFPEFSVGADGKLPNNRTHQLKAFGYYQALPEFGFGGNLVYASGRPKNCIGNAPVATPSSTPFTPGAPVTIYSGYGSAYFFCNGQPSPRGSQGNLPAEFTSDLNFQYTPDFVKGLKLKADIFNVFNRQVAESIEERFNTGTGPRSTYGAVQSYSTPRYVKLTIAYDKKF